MAGEQTTVEQWLTDNDWKQYIDPIEKLGYRTIEGFGDDNEAKALFARIVPEGQPGTRAQMLMSWKAQVAKDKQPPAPEQKPPAIPALKPGSTFDLSSPTITVDNVSYQLPDQLKSSGGDPSNQVSADDLSGEQWMVIARRVGLLRGILMDEALAPAGSSTAQAPRSALDWRVPDDLSYRASNTQSHAWSTLDYTSETSNARAQQIVDASASGQYMYCAASASVDHDVKTAMAQLNKRLYLTGMWYYPRADLFLDQCTAVSDSFVQAIKDALGQATQDDKFNALQAVFGAYGHVAYQKVTLGGVAYFQTVQQTTVEVDENQVKLTVQTAASLKAGESGGNAAVNFQNGSASTVTAQAIEQSTSWTEVGGNTLSTADIPSWSPTVADPNKWDIVARDSFKPLVDYLDKDVADDVQDVWQTGLRTLWGLAADEPLPVGYVQPAFAGQLVYLSSCAALPATSRIALGAYNAWPQQVITQDYPALGDAYPPLVSASELPDAAANNLLWKFVYAKRQATGDGPPLYWILSADGKWALSAADEWITGVNIAILRPAAEAQAEPPATSSATWTVTSADPSGFHGSSYAGTCLLTNWATSRLLGPTAHWSGVSDVRTRLDDVSAVLNTMPIANPGFAADPPAFVNYCWYIDSK